MPYKTLAGGRRLKLANVASNGIQYLVKLDGTKATFECTAGHRLSHDYGKGPITKRISADVLKKFAGFWGLGLRPNGTRGHCYGWCQKCQNQFDGVD